MRVFLVGSRFTIPCKSQGILTFAAQFLGYPRTLLVLCWWGLESYLCDACVSTPFGGLQVHDLLQITGYPYFWCAIPRVSAHSACFCVGGGSKATFVTRVFPLHLVGSRFTISCKSQGILTFGAQFLGYPHTLLVLCWWGLESYLCDACVSTGIRSISRSLANHRVSLLLRCAIPRASAH